jgi:hypothetical protein
MASNGGRQDSILRLVHSSVRGVVEERHGVGQALRGGQERARSACAPGWFRTGRREGSPPTLVLVRGDLRGSRR